MKSVEVIKILSAKYGFSESEALSYVETASGEGEVGLSKKVGEMKPTLVLPYCGVKRSGCCIGLRLNHGLFTQCVNVGGESGYCKTCSKQVSRNGQPTYGTIDDRVKCGLMEYRAPSGKQVVPYANVMSKLGISREEAEEEARRLGLNIPEEQFVVRKASRGRPKKAIMTNDTDSEAGTPKKRGRPKKEKKVVATATGDDLIAQLVAEAELESGSDSDGETNTPAEKEETPLHEMSKTDQIDWAGVAVRDNKEAEKEAEKEAKKQAKLAEKEAKKQAKLAEKEAKKQAKLAEKEAKKQAKVTEKETQEEKEEDGSGGELSEKEDGSGGELSEEEEGSDGELSEEEEVSVTKFEHDGTTYLRDGDGILYDSSSQEPVGQWNEKEQKVDDLPPGYDDDDY